MNLSKAQLRCMDCIKTGLFIHGFEDVRFLTLTTAENMNCSLRVAFNRFVKIIRNTRPFDLVSEGYVDGNRINDFYPDTAFDEYLTFEYIAVKTNEGISGVYHVLFVGDFIPYRYVTYIWEKITKTAKVGDIRKVRDIVKVADYIVLQNKILGYVSGQSKYKRFSYSKNWVFNGYSKSYDCFMSDYWNNELCRINNQKGFVKNPFDLYREIFLKLSRSEKNDFYNKRWSKWLCLIRDKYT